MEDPGCYLEIIEMLCKLGGVKLNKASYLEIIALQLRTSSALRAYSVTERSLVICSETFINLDTCNYN